MPVPQNAQAIWSFLVGQGFNSNAAAGIEGNIEQESGGDPNAGTNPPGKGLIQQLGDPGGTLQQELQRMMTYIRANGSVADINSHSSSPSAAALWFSQKYERPGIPDNANRVASANDVAAAAKSGNWKAGSATTSSSGGGSSFLDPSTWIPTILQSLIGPIEKPISDILERGALIVLGAALILIGLMRVSSGGSKMTATLPKELNQKTGGKESSEPAPPVNEPEALETAVEA